jgi:hypothetical protein
MVRRNILVLLFLTAIVGYSCQNKQSKQGSLVDSTATSVDSTGKAAILDFGGKDTVDLGKIKEGAVVSHTFEFTNSGNAPLKINYCNASCGCTVPTWPKEAIPVGGKASITIEFNSKNKEGKLFKNVSIHANTIPEFTNVGFSVEVINNPKL